MKQAVRLAREQLVKQLKPYGHYPYCHTPNVYVHESRPTKFCLCINNFGVPYLSEDNTKKLSTNQKTITKSK